ncbi:DUF1389 domain-containing protein [Chlamydia psittaci]|uniref:DUF1389 domain-containing protein n=1 Tax=Chlamydia psittaci TaxID=83554 RepID=UPI00027E20D2|nr:DUF1389 domain-containing protein [Chlamydia psittaci]AFS24467.1 hypothetical protein B602_0690 [Chlamydia psittaci M56]
MTCFSTFCCYSQSSLVDDSSHTCNSRRLYRCALAITNICFAILALVCAAFIVSGASELIVILGLVISLVLCGVLLVINLCCFRNSHVVVAHIVDSEMDGVGGSNQRSVTGLISETNLIGDSHVVGDVLEEELPLAVDKVDEESLASVSEVASDFHTAGEESMDGESTSILDTAFQLSSSSVDETLIREETGTADYNLGLLFDNSLTVDTETTLDAEGYVGEETLIPASFHSAIGRNYPGMIHQLCIQENLTIQELRLLIEGVNQGNSIESYPNSLKTKLQNFSFSQLQSESLGTGLRPLDDVLLKECPFYFINRLIALGDRTLPESYGLSPEVYWTSRRGFAHTSDTILTPFIWILSRTVSREEYLTLLEHAENETWSQVQDIIVTLQRRIIDSISSTYQPSFSLRVFDLNSEVNKPNSFLYLCKHGVSWEQLQLFTKLDSRSIDFLCEIELQSRGGHLCRNMMSTFPHTQAVETSFDPHVTLFTWDEWIEDYQDSSSRSLRWRTHESTIQLLNRRRDGGEPLPEVSVDHTMLSGQPYYDYDMNTGARTRTH